MKDQEITKIITDLIIDKDFNHAILIDGPWGCGKTYYIKNQLIKAIECIVNADMKYSVSYISLFGQESIESLKREVLFSFYLENSDKVTKNAKIIKFKKKMQNNPYIGGALSLLSNKYQDLINELLEFIKKSGMENHVFIFDDIERCSINLNSIIGFINELSEQNNAKIIIVTNQSEIGSLNIEDNLAEKYQIALRSEIAIDGEDGHQKDEPYTLTYLDERTKKIFSNRNKYARVIEKLVGVVIEYNPDFEVIIDIIIDLKIEEQKVKDIVKRNKNNILRAVSQNDHYNLRTFIFCITCFERLVADLDFNTFNSKRIDFVLDDIFEYSLFQSIRIKTGKNKVNWEGTTLINDINLLDDDKSVMFSRTIKGFKFVDDYMYSRRKNIDIINQTILQYITSENFIEKYYAGKKNLAIDLLESWYTFDDSDVEKLINSLLKELKDEKYNVYSFPKIIVNLYRMIEAGFEINIEDFLVEMERIAVKMASEIEIHKIHFWAVEEPLKSEIDPLFKRIMNAIINGNMDSLSKQLYDILDLSNWGTELLKFAEDNHDKFLEEKKFLSLFEDLRKLTKKIQESRSNDVLSFLHTINSVYRFSNLSDFFLSDGESVKNFIQLLNEMTFHENQKTKMVVVKELIRRLSQVSMKLSN